MPNNCGTLLHCDAPVQPGLWGDVHSRRSLLPSQTRHTRRADVKPQTAGRRKGMKVLPLEPSAPVVHARRVVCCTFEKREIAGRYVGERT